MRIRDADQTQQISTLAAFQAELARVNDQPLHRKTDALFKLQQSMRNIPLSDRKQAKASFEKARRELADHLAQERFEGNLKFIINQNIDELKGGDLYQLWQLVHDLPTDKKSQAVAAFKLALSTLPASCKPPELQDLERVIAYPTPEAAVLAGEGLTLVSETWMIPPGQIIHKTVTATAAEVSAISPSPVAVRQFSGSSAAAASRLNAQADLPRTATGPGATNP